MKISKMEATYVNHMGDDLSVVNAARVSFHKKSDWKIFDCDDCEVGTHRSCGNDCKCVGMGATYKNQLKEGDKKLINYLAKHKHFSPFNHAFMSFRIKAPIFVARQLVKHKFMPWNEVSRRYVDEEPEFFYPEFWRAKADNVKQGSSDLRCEKAYEKETGLLADDWSVDDHARFGMDNALHQYRWLLESGVAPEQARMVLPQNMMTEWWWSGTLGAYLDMLELRLDPHTQQESREVAQMIAVKVKELFPVSYAARLPQHV